MMMVFALVILLMQDPAQRIRTLVDQLGAEELDAREAAEKHLVEMGASALVYLETAGKDRDAERLARIESVRCEIIRRRAGIPDALSHAIPHLIQRLTSKDLAIRKWTEIDVVAFVKDHPGVVPRSAMNVIAALLLDNLPRGRSRERSDLEFSVAVTGGAYLLPSALPAALALLESDDEFAVACGLETVGNLGAAQAAPIVRTFFRHPDVRVREAAARAAGEIGSQEAANDLRRMLGDCEQCVRVAARDALFDLEALERRRRNACDELPSHLNFGTPGQEWSKAKDHVLGILEGSQQVQAEPGQVRVELAMRTLAMRDLLVLSLQRTPAPVRAAIMKPTGSFAFEGALSAAADELANIGGVRIAVTTSLRSRQVAFASYGAANNLLRSLETLVNRCDGEIGVVLDGDLIRLIPRDDVIKWWRTASDR